MSAAIKRLDWLFSLYLRLSGAAMTWAAMTMFVVMLAVNAWNIMLRSLFGSGTVWHQEISIMAAMWVYFGAYALIAKRDDYVRIEFLTDLMPAELRGVLLVAVRLLVIAFHVLLFYLTLNVIQMLSIFRTTVLEWPEYLYVIPLSAGAADIVVTEIIMLLRHFAGIGAGTRPGSPRMSGA